MWVSGCVRASVSEWLWVTECEWVSEWMNECGWVSLIDEMWMSGESECKSMSVSECEWVWGDECKWESVIEWASNWECEYVWVCVIIDYLCVEKNQTVFKAKKCKFISSLKADKFSDIILFVWCVVSK